MNGYYTATIIGYGLGLLASMTRAIRNQQNYDYRYGVEIPLDTAAVLIDGAINGTFWAAIGVGIWYAYKRIKQRNTAEGN